MSFENSDDIKNLNDLKKIGSRISKKLDPKMSAQLKAINTTSNDQKSYFFQASILSGHFIKANYWFHLTAAILIGFIIGALVFKSEKNIMNFSAKNDFSDETFEHVYINNR